MHLVLLLPISFSVDTEGSFSMLKAILIKQLACWVIGLISRLIPATEYKECSIKLLCSAQKMPQWIDCECMLLIEKRWQIFLSKILLQPICQGTYSFCITSGVIMLMYATNMKGWNVALWFNQSSLLGTVRFQPFCFHSKWCHTGLR